MTQIQDQQWFGYEHINGTLHVKRYLSTEQVDEVYESDFVKNVYGPWKCQGRHAAVKKMNQVLGRK